MSSCPTRNFCLLQGQIYRVYDMALCSGTAFFVLGHSHTMFGSWVYHHGTMCHIHSWPLYDLDLWHQYWNNIFIMNLSLERLSLLFDIGIPNFSIWVYHHETICCVHSWPLFDLDLWPIGRWQGVSLVSFTHSFYRAVINLQEGIWQSHKLFQGNLEELKWRKGMNIFMIWLMRDWNISKRKSVI